MIPGTGTPNSSSRFGGEEDVEDLGDVDIRRRPPDDECVGVIVAGKRKEFNPNVLLDKGLGRGRGPVWA